MQLEDALKKRNRALIAVCTLGLSETPLVTLFKESDSTRGKMSFGDSPAGWIFQVAWFAFLTAITMTIFWIVNIFKLINYAEFVHRLRKILACDDSQKS